MTEASSAVPASQLQEPLQAEQVVGSTASEGTLPAFATVNDLPKPLLDAILQALAQAICSSSQRSTDRIKTILKEQERKR